MTEPQSAALAGRAAPAGPAAPPAPSAPAISPGAAVIRMATAIGEAEAAALAAQGLTAAESRVLRLALRSPSMGSLVASLHAPKSTITSAVDRLEERGLVTRASDRRDRRRYIVTATVHGAARLAELDAAVDTVIEDIVAVLPANERDRLTKLLSRIPTAGVPVD